MKIKSGFSQKPVGHFEPNFVCKLLGTRKLKFNDLMCGVSSNHPWRKQTWWWNSQVEEAVREKRRCFKLWKAGGSSWKLVVIVNLMCK